MRQWWDGLEPEVREKLRANRRMPVVSLAGSSTYGH